MFIYHSRFPDTTDSEVCYSSPVDPTEEMEEELVTIKSTYHAMHVIEREGEKSLLEKMWTTSDCFDITLVCGDGQQVFAHRVVLSSRRFDLKDVHNNMVKNETIFGMIGCGQIIIIFQPPSGLHN